MREPELSGISIVGAGSFNPAIVHPTWLKNRGLIAKNAAEDALAQDASHPLVVSSQLTTFVADWLTVQVTPEQAVFSTVDRAREQDLRDVVIGVVELLPETPIDGVGINSDTHFRLESDEAWHAFGDKFLPKPFWEPLFEDEEWATRDDGRRVGMRSMTIEVNRSDQDLPGFISVEVAPSRRLPDRGVFVGINAHFQLSKAASERGSGDRASGLLLKYWDATRELEEKLVHELLEAV